MTTTDENAASRRSDREDRRWLIGIGITIIFGLFGAIMTWLSYDARANALAPLSRPAAVVPAPAPLPTREPHHKGHGRE